MTAKSREKSAFTVKHLMLQDKRFMIILREKANHGNTSSLLKKC